MTPPAIIPAAGRGTRLRSFAGPSNRTKVMLPVGRMPMIGHAIRDCLLGGVCDIVVVVPPDRPEIGEYLEWLEATGGRSILSQPREWRLRLVEQPQPIGLGDAIICGFDACLSGPFLLVLPDNVHLGACRGLVAEPTSSLTTLLEGQRHHPDAHLLGFHLVTRGIAPALSNVGELSLAEGHDGVFPIDSRSPKKQGHFDLDDGPVPRSFGRALLQPGFIELAREMFADRPEEEEMDDGPVLDALIHQDTLLAVRLEAALLDVGNPVGYRRAQILLPNFTCPEVPPP